MSDLTLKNRPRRLRMHPIVRGMVSETRLTPQDFIYPLLIKAGISNPQPVSSMPGVSQFPLSALSQELDEIVDLGVQAVLLFGIPEHKDDIGSAAFAPEGIVQQAIRLIKQQHPDLLVIADVCCCEYTNHGHCGPLMEDRHGWTVDNDATLPLLAKQAVSLVQAGADIIAPSGMIDGMVHTIRQGLDQAAYHTVPILSYTVKYASHHYAPFREAAEGAPQKGDRKSYQMDMANANEALREAKLDIEEGADMLMVKPALPYLDIIRNLTEYYPEIPTVAYQVSGEYAMIHAAGEKGWLDADNVMYEQLLAIKRAGARMIITYAAKSILRQLSA